MTKELISSFIGPNLDLKSASDLQIHNDEKVISNLFVMFQVCTSLDSEFTQRKENIRDLIDQIDAEISRNHPNG